MRTNPLAAAALLAALLLLPACNESSSGTAESAEQAIDFSTDADTYTVLGIVRSLPSEGPPPTDLRIQHEHIPDFVGQTGEIHMNTDGVPGMKAMTMDFPRLADGVSLEGLAPGDKVRFTFKVKWIESATGDKSPRWLVSAIEPLPDDTPVSFDNKTVSKEASDGP